VLFISSVACICFEELQPLSLGPILTGLRKKANRQKTSRLMSRAKTSRYFCSSVKPDFITAYIGMGSNLGDRAGNLLAAVRCLVEADFTVNCLSNIYETEPVGLESELDFLNMIAAVQVRDVKPTQMMARLLRIEYILGRRDKNEKKPRTIDLDLLFFGSETMDTPFLTLPHPRLHLRKFVLAPMVEIAPRFVHPRIHKTVEELLAQSTDESFVSRWNPNGAHHETLVLNT